MISSVWDNPLQLLRAQLCHLLPLQVLLLQLHQPVNLLLHLHQPVELVPPPLHALDQPVDLLLHLHQPVELVLSPLHALDQPVDLLLFDVEKQLM